MAVAFSIYDRTCLSRRGMGVGNAVLAVRVARRVRARHGRNLRGAPPDTRVRRPRRVLLLSPGGASQHRALDGALTQPVPGGRGPTHPSNPDWPALLRVAHLQSVASARRDLHAGSA